MDQTSAGEKWKVALRDHGYEPPPWSARERLRLQLQSRIWRKLHRLLKTTAATTFFEFGCGGGAQLVPLAFNGYRVAGIDVSDEVLDRCRAYVKSVESNSNKQLPVSLFSGDFLDFDHDRKYDVVFNFGVVEHFLDSAERQSAIRKMADLCNPGGYVVSVVPSGMHPFRARMKREGLGGYNVPEIDYTADNAVAELRSIGLVSPAVYPASLGGFLRWNLRGSLLARGARFAGWLAAQSLPLAPFPGAFSLAASLIIIGRKPAAVAPSSKASGAKA